MNHEPLPDSADHSVNSRLATHRVEALGDGIFAIAMTLLILDFHVPEVIGSGTGLGGQILALWPKLVCYVMSFLMLGVFWIGHHTQFHFIKRSDRLMLWINLAFLMTIAFIPFSTALLGRYRTEQVAILVYGGNMVLCGLTLFAHWRYTVHRNLTIELDAALAAMTGQRILWGIAAYMVGMCVGLVRPAWALFIDAAIPFLYLRRGGIDRYWIGLAPSRPESPPPSVGQRPPS